MICKEIFFSDHAITQMFKRNISVDDVKTVIASDELLVTYSFDKPFPSYLLLSKIKTRPLHIVVAKDDSSTRCVIVIAYEPDSKIWKPDFKSKID